MQQGHIINKGHTLLFIGTNKEEAEINEIAKTKVRLKIKESIIGVGYPEDKAEVFSWGYIEKALKMPVVKRLEACKELDDVCMTAGFEKSGIDEEEAHGKYLKKYLE